jgi:LysR family glycine cleavage system transcriptional activator
MHAGPDHEKISCMDRRLPSLNALLAFEAAARLGSFTLAAGELHVTQSAVSHQVQKLEDELGLVLFDRLPRALRLTPAGERLAASAGAGFDRIAHSLRNLSRRERQSLTVTVLPSFATHWLLPRLKRFHAAHKAIELRIDATQKVTDLQRGDADVAIRYGPGGYRGLVSERLFGEELYPVCAPALALKLRREDDLRRMTLLHDEPTAAHGGWTEWLRKARVKAGGRRGPVFSDTNLLLQAALEGHGVALGRSALVEGIMDTGRLVRPFNPVLKSKFHYSLVMPRAAAGKPEVKAFRDFLLEEAAGQV